ncbi:MAG: hypothetical protein ACI4A7_07335 [Prevotella sp.]
MSSKKYNQGDKLVVTEGQLAGAVGCCVGYGDTGMVKIGFSLGDGEDSLAVLTIPAQSVSLVTEVV